MSGRHEDILNKEKIDFRLGGGAQMNGLMGKGQMGTQMEGAYGMVPLSDIYQLRSYKGSSAAYLHCSSVKRKFAG